MKRKLHPFFTKKISVEGFFVIVMLLVFGGLALWGLPISAGYDEETHFVRVWQMSNLDLLPNQIDEPEIPFPTIYWDLSYRRQEIVRPVEPGLWEEYGNLTIDSFDYTYGVETRSVYSPILLLPQAIVTRYAGRSFGLPALPVFYLNRLAGLLSYLLLIWTAVRLAPYGKMVLALLALSPMALLQAVTISADTISNGIAFLFVAGILAISQKQEIRWKEWGAIVLLSALLFTAKVNLVFLIFLPFLLIPRERFVMKKGYLLLIAAISTLFLVEVLGWSIIAYPRLATPPEGTAPIEQVKFILTHIPFFIKTVASDIFAHVIIRVRNWIALYGYDYWPVPKITYIFYGLALLTVLFSLKKEEKIPERKERFAFLLLFILGYIFTITLMYLSFTPVGSPELNGVQGRYFTVVMPLLFLSLFGFRKFSSKFSSWFQWSTIVLGILSLATYTAGLWLSYQIPCGSQYYQPGLCYQPNYKNFSPESVYSEPLSSSLKLTQEIAPECDGMTSLRIWVNTESSITDGQTKFSFSAENGNLLGSETLNNSELPDSGWYSLSFVPDWDSSQKSYLLSIQSVGNLEENGTQIAYSIRPEYPLGKLYENDEAIEQDIIFQYGCVAGWEKQE